MALRKKTYSARVDSEAAEKLRVIAKVTKASEAKLVEKGLDMVLAEADRNKTALRRQLLAQYEAASRLLDSDWLADSASTAPDAESVDEVPPGSTMFQGKVDLAMAQRLHAVGQVQGRNDSALVRHGLMLVIDEADANLRVLLKKLDRDHDADVAALKAPVGRGPARSRTLDPADATANAGDDESVIAAPPATEPATSSTTTPEPAADATTTPEPAADAAATPERATDADTTDGTPAAPEEHAAATSTSESNTDATVAQPVGVRRR